MQAKHKLSAIHTELGTSSAVRNSFAARLLQDQQEKKLQRFLDLSEEISMGRRLSLPADADRRVSKLDLARDAAKLASQSMARQGNGVLGERQWK